MWVGRALVVVGLAAPATTCDFVSPTTTNPNAVDDPSLAQLFTSVQLAVYVITEENLGSLTGVWVEQLAPTSRRVVSIGDPVIAEEGTNETWFVLYTGGGLVDVRNARALAEERDDRTTLGVLQIIEAYLVGTAASVFGAIPYSEAVDPEIETPALDDQLAVYDAVQGLLDSAIANLQTGDEPTISPARDMSFQMDAAAWIAVAHTLKARYHMHLVELEGAGRASQALNEAQQGIMDPADDWQAFHTVAATEVNQWFEFQRVLSASFGAGEFLVNLLQESGDPRIGFYFEPVDGEFVGAAKETTVPGSILSPRYYGAADFDFPIVTASENAFLAAEAAWRLNMPAEAQTWVDRAIADQEAFWSALTGQAVEIPGADVASLADIIREKYKTMFLSFEAWNDYKRTCEPGFDNVYPGGTMIPARLPYPTVERITNPNIPPPSQQPERNANDPDPCPPNDFR